MLSTVTAFPRTLAALPRDARDTLFLLAIMGWVVLLQSGHLPLWCSALTLTLLVWRGVLAWQGRPLPSRWWLLGLLVVTVGATLLTHRTILGRDAGVTLIALLLALKTLELRARRDAFVVFFLALFTLLTHFFYSQSLLTAAGVLLAVWGLLTSLVNAHSPFGKPPLWQSARTAGSMALLGAPIMLVLFLFFPRLAPLWGMPGDAMTGRSGLSNQMKVGQVAQLAQDPSVALRVKFDGAPPPSGQMYFRGPVLSEFDGTQWRPLRPRQFDPLQMDHHLVVSGEPLNYEVTLEPHNQSWLLTLDATPSAPTSPALSGQQLLLTPDLQWLTSRPVNDLLRYRAQSHPVFRHGPLQAELGLRDHLGLPPGFNPRTLLMAQQWRQEAGNGPEAAQQLVQRALTLLRTGGYGYTLAPGLYGRHTADEFWFDRKQGFCEHIASSFVLLMRALDIPARVVTGYQGGERNPVDGFWTVRQSDAHAWTEVWLAGQGWVRVDPTGSVAPSRTETLQRLEAPQGLVATALVTINPALGERLRATWEAVNNRWNQWVLNYSQSRQFSLLENLGFESPSWRELGYVLAGLLAITSLAGALWALWERRQHDPWLRLLHQAHRRARDLGLDADERTTPRQLATQLHRHFGQHPGTAGVVQWLLAMERTRYAAPGSPGQPLLASLRQQAARLSWPPRQTHPAKPVSPRSAR